MVYTIAEGKFPKKPDYGNVLEACYKDFRNFKKDDGSSLIEHFNEEIERFIQLDTPNKVLVNQKENLESVRKLIHEGKEDFAFSLFFRTFPSCLPHRSRNI